MSVRLEQRERFARLHTIAPDDKFVLVNFDGHEGISENFEWRIDCLLNYQETIDAKDIIGKPCHVELDTSQQETRYFHGICTEMRYCGEEGDYERYNLVLRPWTWLLTRETCCEIFHDKSVRQIIEQIFSDRSGDFESFSVRWVLNGNYDAIPYCVQYQETTYNFISRLMEKFGLFFYFEHKADKHEMVITDNVNSLPTAYAEIRYRQPGDTPLAEEMLSSWQSETRLRTAQVDVKDYFHEKPKVVMDKSGKATDSPQHGFKDRKHFRFPAGYTEPALGQKLADVLVDIERADAEQKFSSGTAPMVAAGTKIKLADHPKSEENKEHFAITASHAISLNPGTTGSGSDDEYRGSYTFADTSKPFKVACVTPVPRIMGAQTAEVISEGSEEIDVDKDGRILVRFHWNDKKDPVSKCSCRLRVAQIWAGPSWGGVWIPRVGMEVVVDFIGGDPDCPLVTGAVYNGTNQPPVKFPADKTQSTVKSDISKGGGGFNEFRFEDKKGSEEIFVHAHRDLKTELIEGDETRDIKKGKRVTTIKMDDDRTITDGNDKHTISKGNQTTTISKGNQTTTISMGNQTTEIKMGNQTTKISAGKGTTTAMQSFEIKVGSSSIKLDPMGVTIKGMQVKIDGSMTFDAKGGISAKVEGGAMCTIKGGMVMIN